MPRERSEKTRTKKYSAPMIIVFFSTHIVVHSICSSCNSVPPKGRHTVLFAAHIRDFTQ